MVTEELRAYAHTFDQRAEELRKQNNIDWTAVRANNETAKRLYEIADGIDEELKESCKQEPKRKCPFTFNDPCGDRNEGCRGRECMMAMVRGDYTYCAIAMTALLGAQTNGINAKILGKED